MHTRLARAKINLYLHVAAPDASGYHPLQSLVAFADIGDQLTITDQRGLTITGPFSAGLTAGEDNVVVKAIRLFEAAMELRVGHGFHLDKQLPLASGIGGGTADAAACLHMLRAVYAPDMSEDTLNAIASRLGADGPMCLRSTPLLAEGYGEKLVPVALPPVSAVLVNPLVECPTRAVYQAFDAVKHFENIDVKPMFQRRFDAVKLIEALRLTRNDLQTPAISLQPAIADVLASLEAQPETRLARMSGSGATCFALCASKEDADALSRRLQTLWPAAWVRACTLG